MSDTTELRRGARTRLKTEIGFRKPRETPYEIRLADLSQYGCQVRLREKLATGDLLWITLPGIEMQQSWVRWVEGWNAGLEFERPMHPAVYDHVARQLG